ncbi:MAG TPA: GNAT family N-acetyltransferase [Pseudolabrys sp.]|nr:GNAT family N-acetyltransferase [Pseudolabrys sp.]
MSQEIAWNGVHALVGHAPVAARGGDAAPAARASGIAIERASAARLAGLGDDWRDLASRADAANVFLNPALLAAAIAAYPERNIVVLLAWQDARLAGVWAFAQGRMRLSAPAMPNAYLATPAIDRDCLEPVIDALLSYIDADPALPNIVALDAMGAGTATYAALARVIAARRGALSVFGRSQRPMLASDLDAKAYFEQAMSASSRKKLRQHRRRLGEKGALESVLVTAPDAVVRAYEDFLALEASGWKGRQGTALASDAADAQFTRAMIAALAARGEAEIHSLTLDGRPVSMQVVLRAGRTAFTWKTCYDEALHDYSPGTLLFEDYSARLLADDNVDAVDSCSFDDSGYMASWRERGDIASLWLDARAGGSLLFPLLARLYGLYLGLRAHAKALYRRHVRKTGR